MKKLDLSLPEFLLVVVTRGFLGAGVGLLLAGRLGRRKSHRVGLTLVTLGALATIPSAMFVRRGFRKEDRELQIA